MSRNIVDLNLPAIVSLFIKWAYVFPIFLLVSLILCFVFLAKTPPKFEAVITIKPEENRSNQSGLAQSFNLSGTSLAQFVGAVNVAQTSGAFYSEITGTKFLSKFIKKFMLEKVMDQSCPYRKPQFFSASGILDYLGIIKIGDVSSSQIEKRRANCLKEMLTVKSELFNDRSTGSYNVYLKNKDPIFAVSTLGNMIDFYFDEELEDKKKRFLELSAFLSEAKVAADRELSVAENNLQTFLISNPISYPQRDVAELYNMKEKERQLKNTVENLEKIYLETPLELNKLTLPMDDFPSLSEVFVQRVFKILSMSISYSEKSKQIIALLDAKNKDLQKQLNTLTIALKRKEVEVERKLAKYSLLTEMENDVRFKTVYLESLNQIIQQKTLESAGIDVSRSRVLSEASAPITPKYPNKRRTILLGAMLSIIFSMIVILCVQFLRGDIFNLWQVESLCDFTSNLYLSKRRNFTFIKTNKPDFDTNQLGLNIISEMVNDGKFGCFIQIGKNRRGTVNVMQSVALLFGRFFSALKKTQIIFLDTKSDLEFIGLKNTKTTQFNQTVSESVGSQNLNVDLLDYDKLCEGNFLKVDENYKNFEKVFLVLDNRLTLSQKFDILSKVDFYFLVGEKGRFNNHDLLTHVSGDRTYKEKCAGFIMIGG